MQPKPDKFIPALYGGLIIAAINIIPGLNFINCLCCGGILLGGFLSVFFYKKDFTPQTTPMEIEDCVLIGVFAGIISAVAGVIMSSIITALFGNLSMQMMMSFIEKMNVEFPPESQQLLDELFTEAEKQSLSLGNISISLIFSLILNTIFSILGALIGWSVFKPKPQTPMPL